MSVPKIALPFLLIVLFATHGLAAMTMEEAVATALTDNPGIQQASALQEAAVARKGQARAPFWPELELNYSYWRGEHDPLLDSRDLSSATATASYNLFNGGQDWFSLQAAKYRATAAEDQKRSVIADTVLRTRQAFIEALRAQRTIETEQKSVELLERQRHDSQLRLEQGLFARNDLLRVDVELATARQRLRRAEGDHVIARQSLARVLGRPLAESIAFQDFDDLPNALVKPETALRQEMLSQRSELRFLHNRLAAETAARKAARGDLMPDLDLVVSYNRFGGGGIPGPADDDYNSDPRATLEASWTLFSGFDTHYELAARGHELRALRREIRSTEDRLTLQLQVALEEFRVAEGNLDLAETAEQQAEENYRVNENRYKARVATTVDLLDAQEFLTRARNERVKALYDLHLAAVALERVLEREPGKREVRDARREVR